MKFKKKIKISLIRLFRLFNLSSEIFGAPKKNISLNNWLNNYYKTYSFFYHQLYEKEQIIEKGPNCIYENINWRFLSLSNRIQPEAFVVKIDNARVVGSNGIIVTDDDYLITDLSREFNQTKYSVLESMHLGKLLKLNANVAVITTAGSNVYYHWIFDILPRLYLLIKSDLVEKIDFFIFPELKHSFQIQSLNLLNLPTEKIIQIKPKQQIKAKHLFVPSLPSHLGTVNQWSVDFLRKFFLQINYKSNKKKIFLTRKNAVGRRIINENELLELLKPLGFEVIDPGAYSFEQQIDIFANSDFIIAAHGSALSNIVFCSENSIVVDIMPPSFIIPCFWILSNKLNINYYYFLGEGKPIDEFSNYWKSKNSDINIDLDKFQILLNKINLEPPCSISHS